MCSEHYYEDKLEEALRDLLHEYRGTVCREDAFRKLNRKISDLTDELMKSEPNDLNETRS
jgi:hypothetical protein